MKIPITVTIDKDLVEYLDKIMEDERSNRSAIVNRIVNQHKKENEKNANET